MSFVFGLLLQIGQFSAFQVTPIILPEDSLDIVLFEILSGMNRMFRCCTAMQIASTSLLSFF
jgi:hypothetical protein